MALKFCTFALMALLTPVVPDEIPEGYVEKSVAVVVRDDAIYVDVRVGLNSRDIQKFVSEWRGTTQDGGAGTKAESSTENADRFFSEHAAAVIADSLELSWGGQRLQPEIVESRPGGQHHVTTFAQFRFARPRTEQPRELIDLTVIDHSFPALKETVRLACKTQGGSMMKESNVVGIVVRAERIDLTKLNPEDAKIARTIRAVIQAPGK